MEKNLIDVCLGRIKADLVVKCKSMLNVFSGEILDDISIAVKGDKIAYVGKNAETMMGTGTEVLKISDGTAVPGLIDAHTHMDMLCTPTEQAKHMLIHGTTTIFAEPDELTSVMGFEGFKTFVKETEKLPLKVYVTIPLAVPQDPKLSSVKPLPISAYKEALTWSNIIGLGETVAWTLMLDKDSHYIEKFKLAIEKGKLIEGHTAGARNAKLAACVCAGISSCHEAINPEQALERLRLGIFLMIREGSVRRDLTAILPDLVQRGIDLSNAALVSDWVDPLDLKELGYMDYIIDKAVEYGLDPVKAIQMVTINPARHFRMDQLIGSIAPGRYADITVLKSLNRPKVLLTIANGKVMARDGKLTIALASPSYPSEALKTMNTAKKLHPQDFEIKAPVEEGAVETIVARLENEIVTRKTIEELDVKEGKIIPSWDDDLFKIAVFDRHEGSGRFTLGLLRGFGAKIGAVASSINFDENQLIVLGKDNHDMVLAANTLIEMGGGIAISDHGKLLEALSLPIAGIMSQERLETVAHKLKRIRTLLAERGAPFRKPLNVLFFATFVTLPEIRFTDKGIVDVKHRRYVPLFQDA